MNKFLSKICFFILFYINLYSISCIDISSNIEHLHKNKDLGFFINFNSENIIIFEGSKTYAYIRNISAFVSYIGCNNINNTLVFENINKQNIHYILQLDESITKLYFMNVFNNSDYESYYLWNDIDPHKDEVKFSFIHTNYGKKDVLHYDISAESIFLSISSYKNDYNDIHFNQVNFYDYIKDDIFSENFDNIMTQSTSNLTLIQGHKRASPEFESKEEQGIKKRKLDTEVSKDNGAIGINTAELTVEQLPVYVKNFLIKHGNYNGEHGILFSTNMAENKDSKELGENIDFNKIISNLKTSQTLIFINKSRLNYLINQKTSSNNFFIVITKLSDGKSNVEFFKDDSKSYNKFTQKINFSYKKAHGNEYFALVVPDLKHYYNVENFYVVGELSIKMNIENTSLTLDDQLDTSNPSTNPNQKYLVHAFLANIFKGSKYKMDEKLEEDLNKKNEYLKLIAGNCKSNDLLVFIHKFFVSKDNISIRLGKYAGIILKQISCIKNKNSFELTYIVQDRTTSLLMTEDPNFSGTLSIYYSFGYLNVELNNAHKHKKIYLDNYVLFVRDDT